MVTPGLEIKSHMTDFVSLFLVSSDVSETD